MGVLELEKVILSGWGREVKECRGLCRCGQMWGGQRGSWRVAVVVLCFVLKHMNCFKIK